MDKIFALLTQLFSITKMASVTLPGLISAGALAFLLRPTAPIDEIPNFKESPTLTQNLKACTGINGLAAFPQRVADLENLAACQTPPGPACKPEDSDPFLPPLPRADEFSFKTKKDIQRSNQVILDRERQKIARCINIEKSWQGIEKTKNDYLNADIANLEKELAAAQETYLAQQRANGTLSGLYQRSLDDVRLRINAKRVAIVFNSQSAQNRQRNIDELNRVNGVIADRMADPGRLRPIKPFDDYLGALVGHVVAFVLLALALGVIITPFSQALTASCYDFLFPEGF